jgi:hypothetical protein
MACIVAAGVSLAGCSSSPRPTRDPVPTLVSAVWSGEAGGMCVQLDRGSAALGSDGLMGSTQLRLSGPTLPRDVYAQASAQGAMCFRIANSPAEFRRIRPGPVTVHALMNGQIHELDTRLLDQAALDRLFDFSLAQSRGDSGIAGPGGSAEIEYRIEPQPTRAGQRATVWASAKATGTRPVYRLRSEFEPPAGSGLEPVVFNFGMIQPGDTLELERRLLVPRRTRLSVADFAVTSTEQHGATIDAETNVAIAIDPLPLPALQTKLELVPDRHGREIDEAMPNTFRPGDDVHLVCDVRNFGDSPLVGGVARLRAPRPETASVRIGRAIVGDLPPSASGRVHIWLVVTAPLGSEPVPIVVEIEDTDLGVVAEATALLFIEPVPEDGAND